MAPDNFKNGAQYCFNKLIACYFLSQFEFCLSFSLSLISTSVTQHCCKCCNLSVGITFNEWFSTNKMCLKNNIQIYVVRTSNDRVSTTCDLYCCFLSQCEALHTCSSGFQIATMWYCDLHVKVMPGAAFTKGKCDQCGSSQKGRDVVANSQLALCWMCNSPRMRCTRRVTPL